MRVATQQNTKGESLLIPSIYLFGGHCEAEIELCDLLLCFFNKASKWLIERFHQHIEISELAI